MIKSCQEESFTNAFISNVKTVNLKIFPNHGGIYTCRKSLDQSIELRKDLSSRLTIIWFQRSYHVHFPLSSPLPAVLIYSFKS